MSNKITELYNNIIENNTPEEINKLRQLLSITKNADIDNKVCKIRILSSNEYNKNLINGTADGSIIAKNENVWHFNDSVGKSALVNANGSYGREFDYKMYYNPNIAICSSGYYNANTFGSCTFTYELSQSNVNNNCTLKKSFLSVIDVFYVYYKRPGTDQRYNRKDFDISYPIGKNTITETGSIIPQGTTIKVDYNITTNFRPVFDFVDNNKSTNIHY